MSLVFGAAVATSWAAAPEGVDLEVLVPEWSLEADVGPPPADPWWHTFADPLLDRLIEQGLSGSPDLAAAEARLDAARGSAMSAASPLLPAASFDLSTSGQPLDVVFRCNVGPIDPAEFASIGQDTGAEAAQGLCWQGNALLNLRWTLDVFGRNLLSHQASLHEARASEAEIASSRLAVSGGLANAYLDAISARLRVQILEEQLGAQSDLLEVLELRYTEGGANGLDVAAAAPDRRHHPRPPSLRRGRARGPSSG